MSEPNQRASLYAKIAAVTAAVSRIPKNGENTFHHYKYALESDITDGLRGLLLEHKLAFLPPSVLHWERSETGKNAGDLTRVQYRFALADCETGETIEAEWWCEAQDNGDKAFNKAATGAAKYWLMKTFLIATGDDPDEGESQPAARRTGQRQQAPPQRMAPTPPTVPNTPPAAALGTNGIPPTATTRRASPAQLNRMFAIAHTAGWKDEEIKAFCVREFKVESRSDLTEDQVNAFIRHVENGSDARQQDAVGATTTQKALFGNGEPNI